jgi:RHS repeat-associated protein
MPVTNYYTVDGQMIGYKTAAGRKDFLTDSLGSVTAEVDSTGATKTFDGRYKPYGGDLSSTGARGSYGWVGTWGYRETGLTASSHYVRARHYSKVYGTWLTADSIWPKEPSYGYVRGMVLQGIDKKGLSPYFDSSCDSYSNLKSCCELLRKNMTWPKLLNIAKCMEAKGFKNALPAVIIHLKNILDQCTSGGIPGNGLGPPNPGLCVWCFNGATWPPGYPSSCKPKDNADPCKKKGFRRFF